jgi:competence protein ComEA
MKAPVTREGRGGLLILLLLLLLCPLLKSLGGAPAREPAFGGRPVYAQIAGPVKEPGVYALAPPATLGQLLRLAGGLQCGGEGPDASGAVDLISGEKVLLAGEGDDPTVVLEAMSAFHRVTLGIPLSLNRESEEGLTAVPGIGCALARAIAEERRRRGGFDRLEEITVVKGIGERLCRKIQPYFTL